MIIGNVAFPHPKVIEVGSLLSTFGAGLQSLTGAPRLLQSIAKDGIIPILNPLGASDKRGEPVRAILVTIAICEFAILGNGVVSKRIVLIQPLYASLNTFFSPMISPLQ